MKRFSPRWLRSFTDYMAVYERKAKSGHSTYALGIDDAGTTFPTFIVKDVPLRCIHDYVEDVKRGWRLLNRMGGKGVQVDIPDLLLNNVSAIERQAELGRRCRPVERST